MNIQHDLQRFNPKPFEILDFIGFDPTENMFTVEKAVVLRRAVFDKQPIIEISDWLGNKK